MIERAVELIDRVGSECISALRTIECDTHGPLIAGSVIGDVPKIKSFDDVPKLWVKNL